MRTKAYCAHLSIHDHWALRCMSRCTDQVVNLKRTPPQCLVPKRAWYSFIDPLKGLKAEWTLPSPRIEPWTCGVEARYATTRPLIRNLMPQKTRPVERLMHLKSIEAHRLRIGVVRKFGEGDASFNVILVT
ncbi:hypothetical protein TNCV_4631811 [Trichonephila clavipes]|nr:hypothetical protein TNCV_4631811 [Trichonephila clavipes]